MHAHGFAELPVLVAGLRIAFQRTIDIVEDIDLLVVLRTVSEIGQGLGAQY